jgi:glutamine amidotransferase
MKVDILDIGSGNISSIKNWIEKANVPARVVKNAQDIESDLLILPGVGSAGSYMARIIAGNYDIAIREHLGNGGRLLGICLGFQIMTKYSEEDGGVDCLGLIDGHVERIGIDISHNGWEPLQFRTNEMNEQSFHNQYKLTKKRVLNGRVFYNHEYGVVNKENKSFSTPVSPNFRQYSGLFVKDKIIGIQFHPEKSQITGLDLISMIL